MSWSEKASIKIARKIVPTNSDYTVGQVSHGVEIFLLQALSAATIVIISLFLGCFTQALILTLSYMAIRSFTGGVHLKSSHTCFLSGIVLILLLSMSAKQLDNESMLFTSLFVLVISLIGFLINLRYAPAEHTYVQIEAHVKQRNKRIVEILLIIGCALAETLVYFGYKQPAIAYSLAVLLQSLLLHPFCFKMVRRIETTFYEKGLSKND